MSLKYGDRIQETTLTEGTGSVTLAGAVLGFAAVSSVMQVGDTAYYSIVDELSGEWEVGLGEYTYPGIFARNSVESSSNGGSLVNFQSGVKQVFLTFSAHAIATWMSGPAVVEENIDDILTVATDIDNVNIVGQDIDNVNIVAGIAAAVTTLVSDHPSIEAVYEDLANIDAVALIVDDVSEVAGVSSDITAVAAAIPEIEAAPGHASTASAAAGVATGQAVISTQQAVISTTQAGLATTNGATQVALATTQAINASVNAQLAATYAASVVQQDLSAIVVQALHRSPNAVTAMCIYDTSKDSDGGAWVDKGASRSYETEPLNGIWLGACAGASLAAAETTARAISGATTGSYYQAIYDGKFYKLNAGSGYTETFRGNKAKFPRLAAIVAEAGNVTIYDLTEPGRPMWRRSPTGSAYNWSWSNTATITSVAMSQGQMVVGKSATGGTLFDFAKDKMVLISTAQNGNPSGGISNDRGTPNWYGVNIAPIANATINAIAMAILPDAPVDPATGLKVPTIAVATAGGVSVIKHDGTVVNSSRTTDCRSVNFIDHDKKTLLYTSATGGITYRATDYTTASFGDTYPYYDVTTGASVPSFRASTNLKVAGGKLIVMPDTIGMNFLRECPKDITKSLIAYITDTYNTGYMVGDIRRCYCALADGNSGSVAGGMSAEMLSDPNFNTGTNWGDTGSVSTISAGKLNFNGSATSGGKYVYNAMIIGKMYQVVIIVDSVSSGGIKVFIDAGSEVVITTAGTYTFLRACGGAADRHLKIYNNGATTAVIDSCSLKEVVSIPDHSYKASGAAIYGTLTKTPVATGSQLVAYSGWSASNYIQESYSADLDFALAEWSISAWVNYTTAVASTIVHRYYDGATPRIQFGTDASGKLTATVIDAAGSPATITVTTNAAYNIATWIKARLCYRAGRLSIQVNDVEVKATVAAPLATLTNANATFTIGENSASTAPFPGSIALVKVGATVPTTEQAAWMYAQEAQMLRDGALVTLPASTAVLDMSYDEADDSYHVSQATYVSEFTGLVRTAATAPSAGSVIGSQTKGQIKLVSRSTTSPGVDISIPAYGLKSLIPQIGAPASNTQPMTCFDFTSISFTANGVAGEYQVSSVSATGVPYVGMGFTNAKFSAGVAGTVITGINSTTYQVSTVHASGNQTGGTFLQSDFKLPCGYTVKEVYVAGAKKQEGPTKDWTRLFDGFCETIRFGTGPASASWVQIVAVKEI